MIKIKDVTNVPAYSRLKQDYVNFFLQATLRMLLKLTSKISCQFVTNLQRYDTTSAHVAKHVLQFASGKLQYIIGVRVATGREKVLENEKCSRSGKSQGISFSVREF